MAEMEWSEVIPNSGNSSEKTTEMESTSQMCSTSDSSGKTVETQEIREMIFSQEIEEVVWGRLLAVGSYFTSLKLVNDKYTFGRGDDCDYQFGNTRLKSHPNFTSYSKYHFILTRETTNGGESFTFIEDKSSNGTYINGDKIGKDSKQVLSNDDEISLVVQNNKAFVYVDENTGQDNLYSPEVCSKYKVSKVLGRGACGEVRLAFSKGDCRRYAIKIISKTKFPTTNSMKKKTNVMNEVNVLKSIQHPCIIKVEDVIDTEDKLYIVLEFVEGGELFDRVANNQYLGEDVAKLLFYQIILAVKYLHDQGITHRDLKPENLLLTNNEAETLIKVSDFGLSKFVNENTMLRTFCGTPTYLAPEIVKTLGNGSYTNAIDCWSLGVILFICLAGYPPFTNENADVPLGQQIIRGQYSFPPRLWSHVSKQGIDLIKRLMTVDPNKRITLAEALEHPWLQDRIMIKKAHTLMCPETVEDKSLKRRNAESEGPLTEECSAFEGKNSKLRKV